MKCPYCNGRGFEYVEQGSSLRYTCPDCEGTGEVERCKDCGELLPAEKVNADGICASCEFLNNENGSNEDYDDCFYYDDEHDNNNENGKDNNEK